MDHLGFRVHLRAPGWAPSAAAESQNLLGTRVRVKPIQAIGCDLDPSRAPNP